MPKPASFRWRNLPDRIFLLIARFEWLALILLLLAETLSAERMSKLKAIWYDEIFTLVVASQPTWHQFLLAMPPEGNPPLNTGLTRIFFYLFGVSAFSLRLAPLLGYLSATVGVFVLIRRECGPVYGLLAAAMLVSQPASLYAFEARPYGLLLAFLTLALLGWQSAAHALDRHSERSRALPLTAMAVGIVGCIFSHNIGIVEAGVTLCIAETVRTIYRRRIDWPVVLTCLGAMSALLITIPMIQATNRVVLVHVGDLRPPITFAKLVHYSARIRETLYLLVDKAYLVAFFVLLGAAIASRRFSSSRRNAPEAGRVSYVPSVSLVAIGVSTILLFPASWLAMIPAGGWYFCRYGIGVMIGMCVVACVILKRSGRGERVLVLLLLLTCLVSFERLRIRYKPEWPVDEAALKVISSNTSGLPMVLASCEVSLQHPTTWWYTPDALKGNLYFVPGGEAGPGTTTLVESAWWAERAHVKAPMEELPVFLGKHDRFLLCSEPEGLLLQYLKSNGYTAKPYGPSGIAFEMAKAS